MVIAMGQIMSLPSCGPPIPSPAASFEEPWIAFTPDEVSGARVESCVGRAVQIRQTQAGLVRWRRPSAVGCHSHRPRRPRWCPAGSVPRRIVAEPSLLRSAKRCASLARAESCRISLAICEPDSRRAVTANRFEGTRNGKVQASSDGRKPEAMRPTGRTGAPYPSPANVSVGSLWRFAGSGRVRGPACVAERASSRLRASSRRASLDRREHVSPVARQ